LKFIFVGLVAIAALALLVRLFDGSKASAQPFPNAEPLQIGTGPLGTDDFWALVDQSAAFDAEPDAQIAALRASLDRLSPSQIADFEKLFRETMRSSYSWDLWGAAYLANGGASDDGFEYFRCWLISKGRRVFEAVSKDPDRLADLLAPREKGGDLEFEEFAYVARDVWVDKTGRDWNELPVIAEMAYSSEPEGTAFSEDREELARRYPKLSKRFGG
jgi:hypothetical protein